MKKLCLFVIASLLVISVFSQSEKGYVYLKNGTILKGKFQYSDDLNKLKVESAGNIWVFNASEIDSVSNLRVKKAKVDESSEIDPVFFNRTELGILAGNNENSQPAPFSFTSSINYHINKKLAVGLGLGIEFLKETYMPAFLNVEYRLRDSHSTPYVFLQTGYQVAIEESRTVYYDVYPAWSSVWPGPDYGQENLNAKGGILINPGIGYLQMFSPNFGMSFAFAYRFHKLHYAGEKDYGLDIDYNRLAVKIGIIFN
ncbi:MAG: hypothetical protein HN778_13515 [Prolixibacteraceae bacterium]|jgi:hypothetical protein|nr:hypothetical protein [Prolixibacteraceae bacterium]MBT6005809.1 hypothetical protein [Prolixibacteraceae bacterium]MBT6764651.1 hypothetical protein [Prolixibacteraceae bacterium]MBT7000847.1 hypothetical protein [Prolixibacteraceae bacterium]MBT7395845.1 hypothetical protein [Prolixibacteraceae bacterium]